MSNSTGKDRLVELLEQKKKLGQVLRKHQEYIDFIRQPRVKIQPDHLIQFAKNISYTLNAPPGYKEGGKIQYLQCTVCTCLG
jgi:hypothetical protein